jgi:thiamine biosynthesis protein ThiI
MYDMILIRYGEMTLKKQNYRKFLYRINENIKNKCSHLKKLKFQNTNYRFYIYLNGEDYKKVVEILETIVGLHSYSLCKKTTNNIEDIAITAVEIINNTKTNKNFSFKVETHRGDKSYPLTSIEISQEVAKRVIPNITGMTVDVHNPDLVLSIDLRNEGTYIYRSN